MELPYMFSCFVTVLIWPHSYADISGGMLYPRESESRQIQCLDGMWDFRVDSSKTRHEGFDQKWFNNKLSQNGSVIPMPVPSSYNDIMPDKSLRDFVGWAWYDREFFVSSDWRNRRVVLRFDSAHYYTVVWVNSVKVMDHNGGHLPFEARINDFVMFGGSNRVTVAVNNTLTPTTLPPGTIHFEHDHNRYPPGYFTQKLQFDFFNYAGIHRSVRLYTTPEMYVDDVTIQTAIQGTTGVVNYKLTVGGLGSSSARVMVNIKDMNGTTVGNASGKEETIKIRNAHFWWPYTLSPDAYGYMYTLEVTVETGTGSGKDVYRQPFGIRTVTVTDKQLLINNRPFYCHGVAKHEDSDIRGKGLDNPLIARDFAMLKWLGANCFRTSHYPYAEEILDQANRQGIAIIGESPGVGIQGGNFGNASLQHHLDVMSEMVRRDKNKPAVIIWSVANEPASSDDRARFYFQQVISHTKSLDKTRPVTFVAGPSDYKNDKAAQFCDIICVNRYYGWYSDTGHSEVIHYQLPYDFRQWYAKFKRPIMITEYGADTVTGLHTAPTFVFTEDYQVEFMREYHKAFDLLRPDFLVGEMVWNFADFMTDQSPTRVVGNKKGVLTRQRQPKMAAYLLRDRYHQMFNATKH